MKKTLFLLLVLVFHQHFNFAQQPKTRKGHKEFKSANPGFHPEISYSSFYNFDADSVLYVLLEDTDSMMTYFSKENGKYSCYRKYWDYQNEKWMFYEKIEHFIDKGLPSPVFTDYMFNTRVYSNDIRTAYVDYMGDSTCIVYEWDTSSSDWLKFYKLERFVSDEGIDTLSNGYLWDTVNSQWAFTTVSTIKTNNGHYDSIIVTDKLVAHGDTLRKETYINTYDNNSRISKITEIDKYGDHMNTDSIIYGSDNKKKFVFCKVSDETKYSEMEEYIYDNKGRKDSVLLWFIENGIQDKILYGYIKYFYPKQSSIFDVHANSNTINFFPNPARENIQVPDYTGNIKIIDLSGQVLLETKAQPGETIGISKLLPGCYIIRFEKGRSGLLIKE